MKKDKYINYKSNDYALKLISVFDRVYQSKLLVYIHWHLTANQVKSLNSFIFEEMSKFSKDAKTIKESVKKKRRRKTYKKEIDKVFLDELGNDLGESIFDEYKWGRIIWEVYLRKKEIYFKLIEKVSLLLKKNLQRSGVNSPFHKNLEKIKMVFKLNRNEIEILTLLYLIGNDKEIGYMLNDSPLTKINKLIQSIRLYCRLLKISPRKMRDYLAKDSNLIKSGILKKSHKRLFLSDYIETYLAGISKMDILENFFNECSLDNSLLLKDHIVPSKNISLMLSLIKSKKGANILLYGRPGTGKTEFAKSLAKEVGLPIFFINQYNEDGEEDLSHRKSAIVASQNILNEKSIIVVDECDPIINTSDSLWLCEEPKSKNDSKAWINFILENTKHKIIWITNRTDSIDVSTKRRFSFSQEFKDLTKKQRTKVWEIIAEKHSISFLDEAEKLELATKFKVNAGGISLAVQDVTSMKSLKKVSDKKRILENILKQHERFVFGKVSKLISKDKSYSSEILNLDVDPNEVFIKLKRFLDYLKENPLNSDIQNMNLLFYGPPGTGKTEFVKHLAENLGVEINLKRLSDIKSKWYGESLKNIALMFEETEESGKILFLDEADSFFVDRESSNNENHLEETNELLTQMENFKGVLVCSTNMLESLDQAVLRRFTMKISFGYLENEAKRELFKKTFFGISGEVIHESTLKKVDEIEFLTPGDYKVVKQKHFFNKNLKIDEIIDDLRKESLIKKVNKRKIGF